MAANTINTMDSKELCKQYNWFANSYPAAIQQACDEFFLPNFKFILLGISKNINTLMDKDAYFVTKVRIDEMHDMFFRLSEKAIEILLEKTLGKPDTRFNLNKLTDLEAKIITSFNDYIYSSISKFLQPAPPTLKRTNFDVIHLTFLLKDIEKGTAAKFIITLPDVLLAPNVVSNDGERFTNADFMSSRIDVKLWIGSTRIKVIDLKNVSEGDIVVLDNSSTRTMVVKFGDFEHEVKLNPNLGLIMPIDNDEGDESMADNTNLWDSIEVELNAEFKPIKITLGELKKIEEGLVMDLTSIYDNKVTLSVEDKAIARGELVIINDRYGVKVNEILANVPKPSEIQEDGNTVSEGASQEIANESQTTQGEVVQDNVSEDDEFDYSDFELEDEDI